MSDLPKPYVSFFWKTKLTPEKQMEIREWVYRMPKNEFELFEAYIDDVRYAQQWDDDEAASS